MYRADPAGTLRQIAAKLRPGGVLAFQELDMDPAAARSLPDDTLWNETGRQVIETFTRAGMHVRMGRELFGAFLAAGLAAPAVTAEGLAGAVRSLAPVMASLGVADPRRLDVDTLAERIRDDTTARGAVVWTPSFVGAYGRRG